MSYSGPVLGLAAVGLRIAMWVNSRLTQRVEIICRLSRLLPRQTFVCLCYCCGPPASSPPPGRAGKADSSKKKQNKISKSPTADKPLIIKKSGSRVRFHFIASHRGFRSLGSGFRFVLQRLTQKCASDCGALKTGDTHSLVTTVIKSLFQHFIAGITLARCLIPTRWSRAACW